MKNKGFDINWKIRLQDYPKTEEFKRNLKKLKVLLKKTLPKQKSGSQKIFTFIGIPGSGKSTLAQIINDLYPSIILRSDWIFFEQLYEDIKDDYYKAYIYQETLTKEYLEQGYSVILDSNNRFLKTRKMVYQVASKYQAEPILINIEVSLETAVKRVTLKGGKKQTRKQKLAGLKNFLSQVEWPKEKERKKIKIIKINGEKNIKEIKKLLNQKLL